MQRFLNTATLIAAVMITIAAPAGAQSNGDMAGNPMSLPANSAGTPTGDMSGHAMPGNTVQSGSMSDNTMGGMSSADPTKGEPTTHKARRHKRMTHKPAAMNPDMAPKR